MFYIGFGHATRSAHLIQLLLSHLKHRVEHIYICTSVPDFLFQDVLSEKRCTYRYCEVDSGVHQLNGYTIDIYKTLDVLCHFLGENAQAAEAWLKQETVWLRDVARVQHILVDAPYLPCVAGKICAIPSTIISNFTFDVIYEHMYEMAKENGDTPTLARYQAAIAYTKRAYATATTALQLPGALSMSGLASSPDGASRIIQVPCVYRPILCTAQETLAELGISKPETSRLLLVAFGGHPQTLKAWKNIRLPPNWCIAVCGVSDNTTLPDGVWAVPKQVYMPDLVNAADCVLGKLGYGTCSECILAGTPLVYVSRSGFIEEPAMLAWMTSSHTAAVRLPKEQLESGDWQAVIEEAVCMQSRLNQTISTDDNHQLRKSATDGADNMLRLLTEILE
jgi:hypothetical protein